MEGKQHGDVVCAIKAGGDETKLLVVDKETDEFFKKCKVIPSQEHLNGELSGATGGPQVRDVGQCSRLDCVPGEGWAASCLEAPSLSFRGGPEVWVGREGPMSEEEAGIGSGP